jgi:hypothetical protein
MQQHSTRIARVAIVILPLRARNSPPQRRVSLIRYSRGRRQRRLLLAQSAVLRSSETRSHA